MSRRIAGPGLLAFGIAAASLGAYATGARAQAPVAPPPASLFHTSDRCVGCHNNLTAPSGEDVSIGFDWRSSMMANSARDPYWQASVRRETLDHPGIKDAIEDKCSICHMAMSRFMHKTAGETGRIFAHLPVGQAATPQAPFAADGVSCSVCHQIQGTNFGKKDSFTGGFLIDTTRPAGQRTAYGSYEVDDGRRRIMRSSSGFDPTQGLHMKESELCATCHTLYTHPRDDQGRVVGELPEQVPYLEWKHSSYSTTRSCQSCHMPVVQKASPIASLLPQPREGVSRHVFRGGNFFMPRLFNRFRAELGVVALPQELDATARRTAEHLQTLTANLRVERATIAAGMIDVELSVSNLAGHKLPTAYPSRRVWIHLTVHDDKGSLLFESGRLTSRGQIVGNDNDASADRYEPHYTVIRHSEEVQIYEPIMVDAAGRVTTGLMKGVRFIKDNRIAPAGFDKATAHRDIAVQGAASQDQDFVGGSDRIRYQVSLRGAKGPVHVRAALWYQPIGFRWAENLAAYTSAETNLFVSSYRALSDASAIRLTGVERMVDAPKD